MNFSESIDGICKKRVEVMKDERENSKTRKNGASVRALQRVERRSYARSKYRYIQKGN